MIAKKAITGELSLNIDVLSPAVEHHLVVIFLTEGSYHKHLKF